MLDQLRGALGMTAPAAPAEGQQGARQGSGVVGGVFRALVLWFIFKNLFGGGGPSTKNVPRDKQLWPKYEKGDLVDMSFHLSEAPYPSSLDTTAPPIWDLKGIPLANQGDLTTSFTYNPSQVRYLVTSTCIAPWK